MSGEKTSKGLIGAGILTAIAASLCCITPVLALIAGSSGLASTFSWLEPARPYLIGITILVIGFAWYQKLKPKPTDECGCEPARPAGGEDEKPKFIQSKTFLSIVTIFAALMIAFPYYSQLFFPNNEKQIIIIDKSNIQTAEFTISGMNCEGCEEEVKHEVNQLNGIVKADVSYKNGNAQIQFDNSKTNVSEIEKAINSTGYTVTKSEITK
ncbi:MAG: mercuric transport protein MerTP [Bacteroidetes bacterium]|nr:mercuric transport protein MerTP [Bacteroidota bacterium]